MTGLDLLYTEVEDDLRASVRSTLRAHCDPAAVVGLYDGKPGPQGLAQRIGTELGLAALLVPEDHGGAGASAREAAVVLEELGRVVAPVPYLTSSVIATTLLVRAGSDLAAELAEGASTAALVVPFTTAPGDRTDLIQAMDGRLSGRVRSVAGAVGADVLLVPVVVGDGVEVYAVDASAATVTAVTSLDMTRPVADIDLGEVSAALVAGGAEGAEALDRALLVGAALLASEQAGVAQWCLETTVAYLKDRRQFGRVVGGFQAVKHRLADLFVEVESAVAAARYAAATVAEDDPDAEVACAVAQAYCSDAAVHAAEEAVQLHGGIGMTWEHPAHLYLKRAKADQLALGTPGRHRATLARLVDLAPPGHEDARESA